jgi:hypothetical protein
MSTKYMIVRFHANGYKRIIRVNLTKEEAIEHYKDPETSSKTCTSRQGKRRTASKGPWFEGWTEQDPIKEPFSPNTASK